MASKLGRRVGDSLEASIRRLYAAYVRDCRRRDIFWGLTLDQFRKLTSADCAYCSRVPAQLSRAYVYNGLDRMDNRLGYTPDNVATACKECNGLKSYRLSFDEMKAVGEALTAHRRRKKP